MASQPNPVANPKAIVSGPSYHFTVLTDRLIRYQWDVDGQFEDRASTFAINRNFPVPRFRVIDGDDLEIITDHFHLTYNKDSFSGGGLVVHFNSKHTNWGAPWQYGDPEKDNLGGTARTLDDCDGPCEIGKGIMSRAGYAAIDDSRSMLFDGDFVAARRNTIFWHDGYLFCYGHDYKGAIKAFFALSGKQPVLPRYALGNWWSRYYAYRQDEYIGLMDDFRAHDIPLSVAVVDMDWHLVSHERVRHSGWTGYTWNKELFPDPEAFGRELHDRNLKISLNDHPHLGVHSHEDAYEEMAQALGHNTSNKDPILFDASNRCYMMAYLKILHRRLERTACDFWWIDWQQGRYSKGQDLDPLWLLNHFQFVEDSRSRDGPPLILSRYAGPGSHRYPVGFSGDTVVSWKSLSFQPEFTATASNIGYGWWSHDIGGHISGNRDDELVTRWVQLGVFSPIFRLHSALSRWMSKEPWLYRPECTEVMSEFMRLRHRLVPFLHTQNIICSREDELLIQPMYWIYPDNEQAYSFPNQYIFGSEFLVAPIVQPRNKRTNLASVKAWLPSANSRYVDLFTGTVYDGNREIILYRALNDYPVLLTEGTIIPMDAEPAPRNGCLNPKALEILVVVGRDRQAVIYENIEDDGPEKGQKNGSTAQQTEPYAKSTYRKTTITFRQYEGKVCIEPISRPVTFRFLSLTSIPEGLKVRADGTDRSRDATISVEDYPQTPSLVVDCPFVPEDGSHIIIIELGPNPQLSVIDPKPRLERQIMDYQTEFKMKDRLWEVVSQDKETSSLSNAIGTLMSFGYEESIIGPVAELLMADRRLYS
ncbi:alpha-xylosidase, putative [Paecilomyces variotii No. 5]|uniref:alpha-glucosidase n=1 Tax=Byssochlamys spectabilis (strain No. 5 / NBRC 109023) TaxID=1356009 RepID=V5GFU3_BYSSN|nr:alpha-xylosidase, putative [Paecilomyces variotii No. 5]